MPATGPAWEIVAGGTIGYDDLTTSAGRATVAGGSALYFSLAAVRHCPVHVVAAVGEDGLELEALLAEAGVDTAGVERRSGRSYRWRAEHADGEGPPRAEVQSLGVYRDWRPQPPRETVSGQILFVGSMPPGCQEALLDAYPDAELVALDSMRDFIRAEPERLRRLARRVDVLFLNGAELEALAPEGPLSLFGGRLTQLVVKEGPRGARWVTAASDRRVPAPLVERVVDPTGAGDALAGATLGRLARERRSDGEGFVEALAAAADGAAAAISAFGVTGLLPD